ncbi:MAG TPA: hypothetical protein VIS31_01020 [Woeseiaceae bacterium]
MSVITTSIALIQLALNAVMVAGSPLPDAANAEPETLDVPARRLMRAHPGHAAEDAMAAGEPDLSAVLPATRDPRLFRRDI